MNRYGYKRLIDGQWYEKWIYWSLSIYIYHMYLFSIYTYSISYASIYNISISYLYLSYASIIHISTYIEENVKVHFTVHFNFGHSLLTDH